MKSAVRSWVRRMLCSRSRPVPPITKRRGMFRPRLNLLEERNLLTASLLTLNTSVDEHAGYAEFIVVAYGTVEETITVDYSIISGSAMAGDDVAAVTGSLTFEPWDSYHIVSVAITDDNATEDDEDFYLELANAVNADIYNTGQGIVRANDRPPELQSIGNKTVEEETQLSFYAAAYDVDSPGETIAYSLDSGAPTGATIDPDTGYFTWTPGEADGPGTFSVTVIATETTGAGLSDSETIEITVLEWNVAPEAWGIADVSVDEDAAPTTIDLFAAFEDAEDTDAQMSYSIVDNSNPALFSDSQINGSTGELQLTYAANANGNAWITVRATDSVGAWVEQGFGVYVAAINDAPVISNFGGYALGDDGWEFAGSVTDVDDDIVGMQVVFGGILAGYSTVIEHDGTFSLIDTWPGLYGTAIVDFTDPHGAAAVTASCGV